MADVNLLLGVDDSELVRALKRDAALLDDVGDEANKTTRTMTRGFNSSAKAVDTTNKELRKTEQQLGRNAKAQKSLQSQIRGGARALRAFGATAAIAGVIEGVKALAEAWDNYRFATDAAFALTKRTNQALKDSIGTFIEQKSASDGLFESLRNTNQGTAEYNAIIDKLVETYPTLTSEQLNYTSSLEDIELAQRAVNAAIIDNIVAEQQARIFRNLSEELANAAILQQKYTEAAEGTSEAYTTFLNLFGVPTAQNFAEATGESVDVLTEQINNIDQVGETLRTTFEQLSGTVLADLTKGFNDSDAAVAELTKTAEKQVKTVSGPLANSLAGLEKQLSEVNKQIREQVEIGATDELLPLIEQQSMLKMAVEDAQNAIKELTGEAAAERVRIAEQLTRDLLLSERELLELQATQQAEANEQQIREAVEDAELRARLLEANTIQFNERLLEIDEQFANERLDEQRKADAAQLEELENTLNQELALAQAQLQAVQAAELLRAKQAGATEEELTQLQAQQEKDRQRLALETEKKKLEFALEFGNLRTQAEIDTTKALIASIESELAGLDIAPTQGEQGGGLLARLGFDDAEVQALKQGVSLAVSELGRLFEARAQFAQQAVDIRNQNIADLRQDLDLQLRLNEEGFASNVEGVRRQLAEEQKAREDALEQQRKAQQAQVALETVTQASSLITASANIFQSLSAAGPIGVGIAIATIATMFGAFAASKAKAFEAARLYDGGLIPRGKDDKYGDGYRVEGTNIRVGGGEFVVNRKDTQEQLKLIKAINKGKFRGVNLMDIIDGKAAAADGVNAVVIKAEQRQQQRQEQLYREAIKEQTRELSQGLNRLYNRPEVFPTDKGRMEVRRSEDNIHVTKIIEKRNGN